MKLQEITSKFKEVIHKSEEPIFIDKRFSRPFRILNGGHKIYVARRKSQRLVPAAVIDYKEQ